MRAAGMPRVASAAVLVAALAGCTDLEPSRAVAPAAAAEAAAEARDADDVDVAFIPPTERVEAAGFHFHGGNDDIRAAVIRRLDASAGYRAPFARSFAHVKGGAPIALDEHEVQALVAFVRDALLDPAAHPQRLRRLIPERLPSGRAGLTFQP